MGQVLHGLGSDGDRGFLVVDAYLSDLFGTRFLVVVQCRNCFIRSSGKFCNSRLDTSSPIPSLVCPARLLGPIPRPTFRSATGRQRPCRSKELP